MQLMLHVATHDMLGGSSRYIASAHWITNVDRRISGIKIQLIDNNPSAFPSFTNSAMIIGDFDQDI